MAESRHRFGPVVLTGLATAALTSVAGAQSWFTATVDHKVLPGVPDVDTRIDMPLALALGLVVLASWGALLVSRGRIRQFVAALGLVFAVGVVACAVTAPFVLPDDLRAQLPGGGDGTAVSPTAWYVVATVASLLSTACLAAAVRLAPRWPTMSSRYDAPTAEPVAKDDTDLWKALDEGRDPTDPVDPSSP
jgi:ribose/xylose/arabinose/galactoside ABC-type transport system permease subunit